MVVESDLRSRINSQATIEREHYRRGKTELFPKKAKVLKVNPQFEATLGIHEGEEFTLEGEGFPACDVISGKRTVFLEQPVVLDDQTYYLEIKGYGQNGRELYGHKHGEGDLYYGMFLDNATREFDYPRDLEEKGIRGIQKPVALMRIPRNVFMKEVWKTLPLIISARVRFGREEIQSTAARLFPNIGNQIEPGIKHYNDEEADKIGEEIASKFKNAYSSYGLKGVEDLAHELSMGDEVNGVLEGREVGYVIRAVRSPFRIGDGVEKNLNERTIEIAKKMGRISRRMLELGYFNISPNPGNWTTEEELVDFEDVLRLPDDTDELKKAAMFWTKRKAMKSYSIESLIEMSYGKYMIGVFAPYFQEGFMGKEANTGSVVQETMQILRSQGLSLTMLLQTPK